MLHSMRLLWTLSLLFLFTATCLAGDVEWTRIKIDAAFRSEGVAAADVNRDGKMDVLAGDVWYQAPGWKMHAIRPVGKFVAGKGYSNSFANWAYDVNGDGWDDFLVIGFPGAPFHWYENPRTKDGRNPSNKEGYWKQHLIWHSACNESPDFADITGDGKPEFLLGSQPERKMGFLPIPSKPQAASKWTFHAISTAGDPRKNGTFKYYHGLGHGDLNKDGRTDVLIMYGWWQGPKDKTSGPWKFHPYDLSEDGKGNPAPAADIHVYDLDLDGDNDLIASSAHRFGVWWFENAGNNRKFKYHLIDDSYSQTHAMEFVDINGDGTKDIVTGKRFYAHNGGDPGGKDPVVMYWYEIQRKKGKPPKFIPHEIEAGRDTGIGTQFLAKDFNGDGAFDIVLSNKKGVNVLLQTRANSKDNARE